MRDFTRVLFALLAAGSAQATALPVRDLNPLLSGYELPPALPARPAETPTLQGQFAISNTSLEQHAGATSLQLDAELQRWQLSFARPLGDKWSLRMDLSYVSVAGGGMDGFIEAWHHSFGLPNGNRAQSARNRLRVRYSTSATDYQLPDASHGLGDTTLRLGHVIGVRQTMLWLSVKLPTGNAGQLTGSGATDLALSLASAQALGDRLTSHEQLSISLLGRGERLPDQQQSQVWSGSLGIDMRLSPHWFAAVQLDGHRRVFSSQVKALGNTVQLSFGPRYQTRTWRTSLLISEDIAVDTAPDVQLQLDVQRRF